MENKINAEDLVKNQDIDASHWAAAFMQLFGSDLRQIDEGLMISWFANSIMVTHDKINNEKDKQIKKLTDENYEIRCQRQSWMNKIDEANYTENSALQQLKEFKHEITALKSKLKIAKETLTNLKSWGYQTQWEIIDKALKELGGEI